MSRPLILGIAAAAAALAPLLPATAQQSGAPVVVTAPVIRDAQREVRGVQPRARLATRVAVETGDLDLRTAYGREILDQRVRFAAQVACDRLDEIDPPAGVGAHLNPDGGDCRHLAAKSAQWQVRAAIMAAG